MNCFKLKTLGSSVKKQSDLLGPNVIETPAKEDIRCIADNPWQMLWAAQNTSKLLVRYLYTTGKYPSTRGMLFSLGHPLPNVFHIWTSTLTLALNQILSYLEMTGLKKRGLNVLETELQSPKLVSPGNMFKIVSYNLSEIETPNIYLFMAWNLYHYILLIIL